MPPRQLGEPFGVLVALDIGRGGVELALDLGAAGTDHFGIAPAPDQGGEALADLDPVGAAQVVQRHLFQPAAKVAGDDAASGQDRDVLQHGLPPVAELRRVDRHRKADAVPPHADQADDHFGRQFVGDDQQRPAGAGDFGQQVLDLGRCAMRWSVIRISGSSSTARIVSTSVTMWCEM